MPQRVLRTRLQLSINTTLVADSAKAVKEKHEKQTAPESAVVASYCPTDALAQAAAETSTNFTHDPDESSRCSTCNSHIGNDGCASCIAEADDGDYVPKVNTNKRKASEMRAGLTIALEVPALKRETSPDIKRESSVAEPAREDAEDEKVSYVSSRCIGNRHARKRIMRGITYDGETVKVETGS